jgi:2,4-dienoyl-CoA reductase-like NADH-dependent reductase (Old Yellow Enzyme family)/thioredoxin reductase
MPSFPHLFSSFKIGKLEVKNRLVMAPMGTNSSTWTGVVTDRQVRYHEERARGGVGLICVQSSYVHPSGKSGRYTLGIHDDAMIPGLRRITDAVHAAGARIVIQIGHGGRRCKSAITGTMPLGPSAVPCIGGEIPQELTPAEIREVVSWFVSAANRAREANFDGVMLHMANGYLLNEFLSPYANKRMDEYGGNTERRTRLALEIVQGTRLELGPDFPILCRLCVDEGIPGGLTLPESQTVARFLAQAGVNAIEAVSGVPESIHLIGPPMALRQGFRVSEARALKEALSIPVIASGRINDPVLAEKILRDGEADFISMGRALLADPDLPNKAMEGRLADICPCIACNEGCNQRLYAGLDVSCVTNPRAAREGLFAYSRAERTKKVLVAGGGPAGMMAAVTAARRGHQVTLCEGNSHLGGQLLMGSVPPHKEEIRSLTDYLIRQVEKSGIELQMEKLVTEDLIREIAPEVVIIATGAKPAELPIPTTAARVVNAWDVLRRRNDVGKNVVVIGGGEVGCEVAEYLAVLDRRVVILELLPELVPTMEPRGRRLLLERLQKMQVQALTQCSISEVQGPTVFYVRGGLRHRIDGVDSVVAAVGSTATKNLSDAVKGMGMAVYAVGDCVKPRRILEAIREGFESAFAL